MVSKNEDRHQSLQIFRLRLPLLVTGCARSGTHYTAHLLQLLGLKVNHEALGPGGAVDWHLAAPRYRDKMRVQFDVVIHQYREPLKVIQSMQTTHRVNWRFIEKFCPRAKHKDKIVRAALYWIHWNRMAEEQAALSLPLERFAEHFDELSRTLGIGDPDPAWLEVAKASASSRSSASTYGGTITYEEIARRDYATFTEMKELAKRYGYSIALEDASKQECDQTSNPWRRLAGIFRSSS